MIDTATSLPRSQGQGVELVSRAALAHCGHWKQAFCRERKDHRDYEIVEDTIRQGFEYRYIVTRGSNGSIRAIQTCFIVEQDLLQGAGQAIVTFGERVRRISCAHER